MKKILTLLSFLICLPVLAQHNVTTHNFFKGFNGDVRKIVVERLHKDQPHASISVWLDENGEKEVFSIDIDADGDTPAVHDTTLYKNYRGVLAIEEPLKFYYYYINSGQKDKQGNWTRGNVGDDSSQGIKRTLYYKDDVAAMSVVNREVYDAYRPEREAAQRKADQARMLEEMNEAGKQMAMQIGLLYLLIGLPLLVLYVLKRRKTSDVSMIYYICLIVSIFTLPFAVLCMLQKSSTILWLMGLAVPLWTFYKMDNDMLYNKQLRNWQISVLRLMLMAAEVMGLYYVAFVSLDIFWNWLCYFFAFCVTGLVNGLILYPMHGRCPKCNEFIDVKIVKEVEDGTREEKTNDLDTSEETKDLGMGERERTEIEKRTRHTRVYQMYKKYYVCNCCGHRWEYRYKGNLIFHKQEVRKTTTKTREKPADY